MEGFCCALKQKAASDLWSFLLRQDYHGSDVYISKCVKSAGLVAVRDDVLPFEPFFFFPPCNALQL